jgi:hypothetical protein
MSNRRLGMAEAILEEITDFYLQSPDFNGIPLRALLERVQVLGPQL